MLVFIEVKFANPPVDKSSQYSTCKPTVEASIGG